MYLYVCLFTPSATCPVYTIVTSGIPREYISTLSRSFFYDTSFPVLSQLSRYSFHSPLFQSMNIVTFFIPLASFSKCHKCHDLCSAGLFNIVSQLSPSYSTRLPLPSPNCNGLYSSSLFSKVRQLSRLYSASLFRICHVLYRSLWECNCRKQGSGPLEHVL